MDKREQKKSQLENVIQSTSKAIESQIGDYKDKGKNALIIGGIVVAAYAFSRLFSSSDEKEDEKVEEEGSSFLGNALTGMVTTVLLTLAKDKILGLIEQMNQNEDDTK